MATIHLEPADLSAAQTLQVLAALNQAESARQLAERIELPGEPDVGVKLAERLLRARAAAGGQFSALAQVAAVPLIGPERFTDLCVAVLGKSREQLLGQLHSDLANQLAQLQRRLAQLEGRSAVAGAGGAQLRVELGPQPAWLGQSLQIVLHVADAQGAPLANRLLTVDASRGVLSYSYGFSVFSGSALPVRSGADGAVRLRLDNDTGEALTGEQRTALQAALAGLDPGADTPELVRQQFAQLAADYDGDSALRLALDIYARDHEACLKRVNVGNVQYEWPLASAVVRVHLHADESAQQVVASAVAIASWQNWVAAWLSFLGERLAEQSGLGDAFGKARRPGATASQLVDQVLGEAHVFVASQKGFAAELLSHHVVGDAVNQFLASGIDDLGDDVRQEIFPSLELAATQIRAGNRGTLSLVSETRRVITRDVDQTISTRIGEISQVNGGLLQQMQGLRDEVVNRANALDTRISGFDHDYAGFTAQLGDFKSSYNRFTVDYEKFNADRVKVGDQLGQFNADLGSFQTQRTQISHDLSTLRSDMDGLSVRVNKINIRPNG